MNIIGMGIIISSQVYGLNGTPNGGSVAIINPRTGNNQISKSKAIPYYGVATEADIAACCGSLEGSNIMIAAGNVQNYANISLNVLS